jgi:chromate transporter
MTPSAGEVFRAFLRFGLFGFGGPLAVLGMMRQDLVERRRWLDEQKFRDITAVAQLLPGPITFLFSISAGEELAGVAGGLAASSAYVLPSFTMALGLAALYAKYGSLATVQAMFAYLGPVAIAVVAKSAIDLGKMAVRTALDAVLLLASFVAIALLRWPAPYVIIGLGALGWLVRQRTLASFSPLFLLTGAAATGLLGELTLVFLRTGALSFGGGPVVIPLMQAEVVERLHWLSARQFVDAVAIGQITPGPFMITATFIGYIVSGALGAVVATLAILFLPYVFMHFVRRGLARVKAKHQLDLLFASIFPAGVGAVAGAAFVLAQAEMASLRPWIIAVVALLCLVVLRIGPATLFAIAGALGVALHLWQ